MTMVEDKVENVVEKKSNLLKDTHPHLLEEWDYEKNSKLGLSLDRVTYGSEKVAWWVCRKEGCESSYDMPIYNRTGKKSNCPYCVGVRVNDTNSLASLRPDLAKQWHPTKNGDLTPDKVTCGKGVVVWWYADCGHEWDAEIRLRVKGYNCPFCSNKRTLKKYNDLWTTHSEIAKMLLNPEDGFKYTYGSDVKLDWKCEFCNTIVRNKRLAKVTSKGLPCPICSKGMRYPEKVMYHLLLAQDIEFIHQKSFPWSDSKMYDFYIPKYDMIIETHGGQHFYENGFCFTGGRTLQEEHENDRYKEKLARENDIEHYIVIDCRKSDFNWVKDNIKSSNLLPIIKNKNIDWVSIEKDSSNPIYYLFIPYWNQGMGVTDIAKIFKMGKGTVKEGLKLLSLIGKIDYSTKKSYKRGARIHEKEVVQLTVDGEYINTFKSIKEAEKNIRTDGKIGSNIGQCCKGNAITSLGFRWMYKDDYDSLINK